MWTRGELEALMAVLDRKIIQALDDVQWHHAIAEVRRRENKLGLAKASEAKAEYFVELHNLLVSERDGYRKQLESMTKDEQ